MLEKINYNDIYEVEQSFSLAKRHFSFAKSVDRSNLKFGNIIILNDEIVRSRAGFALHPHKDVEILTYIINGNLTHKDSMGGEHILSSGEIQYMSAGTGIYHSEYNETDSDTRLLQIWLLPNIKDHEPDIGFIKPQKEEIINKLYGVINTNTDNQFLKTNVRIYLSQIVKGKIEVPILLDEVGYLINIEGESIINDLTLKHGDALKFDENLTITGDNAQIFILITRPT